MSKKANVIVSHFAFPAFMSRKQYILPGCGSENWHDAVIDEILYF